LKKDRPPAGYQDPRKRSFEEAFQDEFIQDPPLSDDVDHLEDEPAGDFDRLDRLQELFVEDEVDSSPG